MICNNLDSCIKNIVLGCKNESRCIHQRDKRKNITCKENRKRYNLENPDLYNVTVYHVDGGIIYNESNMAKCDYLYVVDDEMHPSAIFIELKGKNIHHAMQQLHSTMMQFSSEFKQYRKYARIICSAVPRIANDPNTLKLMKEMKKQNIDINMQEHSMSEDYSTLV